MYVALVYLNNIEKSLFKLANAEGSEGQFVTLDRAFFPRFSS